MVPVLPVEDVERLDAAEAIERKRRARAGIGRMWGNVPNDVWILDALMTAMSSALPSAPMPARTVVHHWMASIGRRVRRSVVVGGMVYGMTPSRFAGDVCGFLAAHLLHDFQTCMAWLCTSCCLF